jgi:hypothetical protein
MSLIYFLQEIPQMLFHPTVGQISSQCQIRIARAAKSLQPALKQLSSTTPNNQLQPWDPTTTKPQQWLQQLQQRQRCRYLLPFLLPTTATLLTPATTIHKSTPTSTTITNNCKKANGRNVGPNDDCVVWALCKFFFRLFLLFINLLICSFLFSRF